MPVSPPKDDDYRTLDRKVAPLKSRLVSIVDDDESVRDSISSLLRSAGLTVKVFASAEDFLNSGQLHNTACLILDLRMLGMTGLELQYHLIVRLNLAIPTIFITAHGDEKSRARALKDGALDFLSKPFSDEALFKAVHSALKI